MSCQGACLGKAFIALSAFKWSITRVDTQMFLQVAFFYKAFMTQAALMWLPTRMDKQVPG